MKIRKLTDIHDEEFLASVAQALSRGDMLKADELDRCADMINKRYPFVLNRIDWSKMPDHLLLPATPRLPEEERNQDLYNLRRAPEYARFIVNFAELHNIGMHTPVWFVGDGISFALKMKLSMLIEHAACLFAFPQHAYVIPETADWCLNYTYENDFFFGFAPK